MADDTYTTIEDAAYSCRRYEIRTMNEYVAIGRVLDRRLPELLTEAFPEVKEKGFDWFLSQGKRKKKPSNGTTTSALGTLEKEDERKRKEKEAKQAEAERKRKEAERKKREAEERAQQEAHERAVAALQAEAKERALKAAKREEERRAAQTKHLREAAAHRVNPEVQEAKDRLAAIHELHDDLRRWPSNERTRRQLAMLQMLDMCIDPGGTLLD